MFVVTIDIWPHGRWLAAERHTTIVACNDGTAEDNTYGNYQAIFIDGEHDYDKGDQRWMLLDAMHEGRTVKVRNFPRGFDQQHLLSLVAALIEAHGGGEYLCQ